MVSRTHRKIFFVEPRNPNVHIFSHFKIPRLGSFILAALMKERGWDAEVLIEDYVECDFDELAQAGLVGITTITPTAPRAYAICDEIRKRGGTVVLGGPHVTFLVDEALEHADFVIRGEGENPLLRFIDQWEGAKDFSRVPSLSYRLGGRTYSTPQGDYVGDLNTLPLPNFSLARGNVDCRVGGVKHIPVQTSRGCPFQCSFCSVTGMFGHRYRYRSIANIMDELRQYDSTDSFVFFCDDNFTDNRKHLRELLKAMIQAGTRFQWSAQSRVGIARDGELVRLMKRAGCHTLFIGFESISPDNLIEMKKRQTVEDIRDAAKLISRVGIRIHGMFVYGFDHDDVRTINQTLEFAKASGITSAQFLILTPLPGSELYNRFKSENRILFTDWALYDTHHVVFRPKLITIPELQAAQVHSHASFYSWRRMFQHLLRRDWMSVGIAIYARSINRKWKRRNKLYCRLLKLFQTIPGFAVPINFHENVQLGRRSRPDSERPCLRWLMRAPYRTHP